ncbi:MAG: hypothetical protein LW845_14255, partial [Flammeovirgaceae bacterium]|nr:hypothetical protein [Flammeovirgaceae bacterium]
KYTEKSFFLPKNKNISAQFLVLGVKTRKSGLVIQPPNAKHLNLKVLNVAYGWGKSKKSPPFPKAISKI